MIETAHNKKEKAFLVGVHVKGRDERLSSESLSELALLARTADAEVSCETLVKRESIDPACFIGRGKAEEIRNICGEMDISTVIFDEDLSPAQQSNLEGIIGRKIVDRTLLILDIFAKRARTREGILQVELAQLQYLLPRLAGKGITLAQQSGGIGIKGGIGVRGPGEKKIEYERRRLRKRIELLEKEIDRVKQHRDRQRKKRQKFSMPVITLVGYTNAGKSTLLNRVASAGVFVEDKLFATLDPTIRRVVLPDKQAVLFADTVGFIHKLPYQLIAAFRATLEEITFTDILVHVADVSHPQCQKQIDTVEKILSDIKVLDKPTVFALNKIDLVTDKTILHRLRKKYGKSVCICAKNGSGIDRLFAEISSVLGKDIVETSILVPFRETGILDRIYKYGSVISTRYDGKGIRVRARVTGSNAGLLKKYAVKKTGKTPG